MQIQLIDANSATALSQILPIILLGVLVELRRTRLHMRGKNAKRTRTLTGAFFVAFGIVETVLVLSIDGRLYPFEVSDLFVAILIFALLWLLFVMSRMSDHDAPESRKQQGDVDDPR